MKLKYYLRGLGVGIFVSTILLMIAFRGHKNELSDEEIIAQAKQLGMVMQEETETENVLGETETTESDIPVTKPEDTENVSNTEDVIDTEGSQDLTVEMIDFTIKKGDSSNSVALELYIDGLVDDADAFNQYMVGNGYDSFILVGTVQIPKGASYEEIAKILTEKK